MHIRKRQNDSGEWYWALIADNGKSIAIGGETYKNETDCNHSLRLTQQHIANAEVRKDTVFGVVRDAMFYNPPKPKGLFGRTRQ